MFEVIRNHLNCNKIPTWLHSISKVYLGDIFSKIFTVGTLIILVRGLSIGDYAAYTAFYAILVFAPNLIGSGINRSMVRFSVEQFSITGKKSFDLYVTSFIFQIVLYIGLCVVVLFSSGDTLTSFFFGEKPFGSALNYGLIAGFGLLVTQAGRSIYQAEERFGMYIKTLWFRQVLIFLAILALFYLRILDFHNAATSVMIVELFIGAIVCWHIFGHFKINMVLLILRDRLDIVKDFLSASKWLIAYSVSLAAFDRLNIFMLSHLSTESELANFGVAYRYFSIAMLVLSSIHAVLLPFLSKVEMHDTGKQRTFALKWITGTCWLILPLVIAGFSLKPLFVRINGEQYNGAFYILLIFIPCVWFGLMCSPLINIIIVRKELKLLFSLGAVAFVFSFFGNYFAIPLFGGMGAAVIAAIAYALVNVTCGLRVLLVKKHE